MDIDKDYLVKEQEYIHECMIGLVGELRTLERYSVSATAIFWAWVASNPDVFDIKEFSFLSTIFVLFLYAKSLSLAKRHRSMAGYLEDVESIVFKENLNFGWQRSAHRAGDKLPKWSNYYYIALLIMNLVLAVWFCFR